MQRSLIKDIYPEWYVLFEKARFRFIQLLENVDQTKMLDGPELEKLMKYYSRLPRLLTVLKKKFTKAEIEETTKDPRSPAAQAIYLIEQWSELEGDLGAIAWHRIPPNRSSWLIVQTQRTLDHMNDYLSGNCMDLFEHEKN